MTNFLEQLVAEWHEHRGYFVRRNVRVGRRAAGGHVGELDVVAFHPELGRLVHVEASMDADSWRERGLQLERKFAAGREHIPSLFKGLELPRLEQLALFISGAPPSREIAGGKIILVPELLPEIRSELIGLAVERAPVSEQFMLLRALQFAAEYWR